MSNFGAELVDSLSLPRSRLDLLFISLLLTAIGVFVGGNLLLLDFQVGLVSARVGAACVGILLIFYGLSRALRSPLYGLALTYSLLWAVAFIGWPSTRLVFYALVVAVLVYTSLHLRVERSLWLSVFLMAVIGTATVLGVERAYTSFDMLSRLHAGQVHQDTLFHASIAAMIKNYGVVSTGLHGLVETPYHAFSHTLMAAISLLSGVGVFEVYGIANWVLFSPLLIFCITSFCAMLDRTQNLSLPLVWGLTASLLSLLPWLLWRWGVWDSCFVSESYLVSLGVFLLGLGLLFKRSLRAVDLMLVVLLSLLIGSSKLSVGMIFAGLWFTRLLFVPGERRLLDFGAAGLAVLCVGWIVADVMAAGSGNISLKPLHFVRNYSYCGSDVSEAGYALLSGARLQPATIGWALIALISFWMLHFSVSLIVIGWSLRYRGGWVAEVRAPLVMYSLAAVFAGSIVIALFAIPGGSAFYFSNVAFFVSLPFVIGLVTGWLQGRAISINHNYLLAAGVVCIILISWQSYYCDSALHPRRHSQQAKSPLINVLLVLRDTSNQKIVLRAGTELKAQNPVSRCTAQPFVYPAVSERPWTGVIEGGEAECAYRYYGYSRYGLSADENEVTIPVRLLRGMRVSDVSVSRKQKE